VYAAAAYSRAMQLPRTLATRIALIGGALLVLALASIGLTLWVSWQLAGGAAAVNEAGRLRMQTWRLAASVAGADPAARDALVETFDTSLELLRRGDPARPLFVPWNDDSRRHFGAVERGWAALREAWGADAAPAPAQAEAFVRRVDAFVDAIEAELAGWTAILNLFQLAMLGLAIVAAVALMAAAYLFVLNPLERLRSGLARVQAGDLGTRVEERTSDEFGALADGFNRMAETLQGLYQTLEAKVREKTARLELERERLAALYAASDFLARSDSLQAMADGFARQVRRIARADAVAIRWSDEANQRYHLLAGDCLPHSLAEDEHCLRTGDCLCGRPRDDGGARVIPIQPERPEAGRRCARAGFETLVSVPMRLQQRLLGEIDLFYRGPAAPTDDERGLLDALAAHLAGAMEGLRAGALERESAVAEERGLLARELHDSIAQSLAFLKIQVQLLRDALRRGDAEAQARALDELDAGVRESTADVRELLLHFRTRTNGEDIVPALRATLQKFEHQTGLPTHLDVQGDGLPLAPDVQVQVLHVLQEALSNVRKHAAAHAVWLEVQRGRGEWRFEVRDDGRGFDAGGPAPDETHVGLRIMRERAERIGATVTVDAVRGAGTCVTLALPAPAAAGALDAAAAAGTVDAAAASAVAVAAAAGEPGAASMRASAVAVEAP
jgi:two-component system, NarL family, nitrate/nitrite sensor histidine kinase NarX